SHDGTELRALVKGRQAGKNFEAHVAPRENGGLSSRCSCAAHGSPGTGPHCQHVVAGALIYLARLRPQLLAAAAARQEAERQEGAESGEPVEAAAAADVAEADEEEVEVSAESSAPAAGGPALAK